MIPKLIHYIWLGGEENFSELNKRCMASWRNHLADFEIIPWHETHLRKIFEPHELDFFEQMYQRKKYAFAVDYARCLVLEKYGGIYLDTDVEVIRNLTPLLDCQGFLGLEANNRPNCAVFAAQADLPFLRALKQAVIQGGGVVEIPVLAHKVLLAMSHGDKRNQFNASEQYKIGAITLYPQSYFYPYNPYKPGALSQLLYSDIGNETYTVHHWQKTWKLSPGERLRRYLKKWLHE